MKMANNMFHFRFKKAKIPPGRRQVDQKVPSHTHLQTHTHRCKYPQTHRHTHTHRCIYENE